MKRVPEEHEPAEFEIPFGRDLRGDPAAHRLAPDEQPAGRHRGAAEHRCDRRPPRRFEDVVPIGNPLFGLGVQEIERHHVYPARRQSARDFDEPRVSLGRPRAVAEYERRAGRSRRVTDSRRSRWAYDERKPFRAHARLAYSTNR